MSNLIRLILIIIITGSGAFASVIEVSPNGNITSVKAAIESASPGDTIIINGGVYKEGNILITKPVVIIGKNKPVLDGEWKSEIMSIEANDVVIQGITFRNVGLSHLKDNAAIRIIKSKHCTIKGNTLLDTFFGIYLENSDSCTLANNIIIGKAERESTSGNAIHLWYSTAVTIQNNQLSGHRDGIYLEFVEHSRILGNKSKENLRYGLHFMFSNDNVFIKNQFLSNGAGVAVMYSKRIEMEKNIFRKNQGAAAYGILLKDITDSKIVGNDFDENTIGILAEGSNRILINNNNFLRNGWAAKVMGSCEKLEITGNNFIGNSFELSVSSKNITGGHLLEKNFWSGYSGYDLDRDGIGDVPYSPVKLFSYLIEKVPSAVIMSRSLFIDLLELAEKVTPSLTPANLTDNHPRMKQYNW